MPTDRWFELTRYFSVILVTVIFNIFFITNTLKKKSHTVISNKGSHNINSQRYLECIHQRCNREAGHSFCHFLSILVLIWELILLEKKHVYSKISKHIFYTLSPTIFNKKNGCKIKGFLTMEAIIHKQRCWDICIFLCSRFKTFIRFSQSLSTKKTVLVVRTWSSET